MSDSTEDIVEVEGYAEVTIEGREEALEEADQKIREVAEILRVVKKDSTAYARAFLDAVGAAGALQSALEKDEDVDFIEGVESILD
jgi:hypothetical protein